jgi:arsenical pump membrane protein
MLLDALQQTWPPFVLVGGLLLIGRAAGEDGLYQAVGARIARARLGSNGLLTALLGLVAIVTAILNLDTAVVFLTPVLLHAARGRELDERPFLYGTVFMSNSASLLLPGSNLTNMIVLPGGSSLARQMLLPWLVACALTALVVSLAYRPSVSTHDGIAAPELRLGPGAAAVAVAAILVVALPEPALPVLAVGLTVTVLRRVPARLELDLRPLVGLFALALALGVVARSWHGPASLLAGLGAGPTTVVAAAASVLFNNLPAASLLSARPPAHPHALLLGLDLGPNLAVTGSLSAWLWLDAARASGSRPSIGTYTRLGAVVVPLTLAGSFAALALEP